MGSNREPIDFPNGFKIGRYHAQEWTPRLTVSREVQGGEEICVCWIGTFWLVTSESGGWTSDEGIAVGFDGQNKEYITGTWSEGLTMFDPLEWDVGPLSKSVMMAPLIASAATLLLPAIDEAFAIGANLERTLAALEKDPTVQTSLGHLLVLALGLLWVAEEERREAAG